MKKTFLLFVLISSFIFGQEKIEGIGPYKIGKLTEKQLDSLMAKASKKKILAIGDKEFLKAKKTPNSYVKHVVNLKNLDDNVFTKYYLENVSVYKIKNLTINGKYKITDAELIFADGILCFFYFNETAGGLSTDLETKYGEGNLKSLNTEEYCYIKDERFPYEEESYYRIWKNEAISLTFAVKSSRDRDTCNKTIKTFIIADDSEKIKRIDLENESLSNSIKEKLKNEEKSKLQEL